LWPNAWRIFQLGSLDLGLTASECFVDFGNVFPLGSSAQRSVVVAFPIAGLAFKVTPIRQSLRRSVIAKPLPSAWRVRLTDAKSKDMSAILFGLIALGYVWLAVQANNKFELHLRRARLSKSVIDRPSWLFKDAVFVVMVGPPLLCFAVFAFTY